MMTDVPSTYLNQVRCLVVLVKITDSTWCVNRLGTTEEMVSFNYSVYLYEVPLKVNTFQPMYSSRDFMNKLTLIEYLFDGVLSLSSKPFS